MFTKVKSHLVGTQVQSTNLQDKFHEVMSAEGILLTTKLDLTSVTFLLKLRPWVVIQTRIWEIKSYHEGLHIVFFF